MGKIEFVNGVIIKFDNDSDTQSITELAAFVASNLRDQYDDNPYLYREKYQEQIELFERDWEKSWE